MSLSKLLLPSQGLKTVKKGQVVSMRAGRTEVEQTKELEGGTSRSSARGLSFCGLSNSRGLIAMRHQPPPPRQQHQQRPQEEAITTMATTAGGEAA